MSRFPIRAAHLIRRSVRGSLLALLPLLALQSQAMAAKIGTVTYTAPTGWACLLYTSPSPRD